MGHAMGNVTNPVRRKLRRILSKRFPPPATVKLQEHKGIFGVVRSAEFVKLDVAERLDLIGELMAARLSREEREQVLIIVCVTPDEGTGYLPGVDCRCGTMKLPPRPRRSTLHCMSPFKVNIVACNPKREESVTPAIEVLVDTGAELTWLPGELLSNAGIAPRRKRTFQTATKQVIEREVGYAILRAEGYETTDEVVFAQPSDLSLLGVRTLEGFGVRVDNLAHRFVATTTLVAAAP